MQRRKHLAIRHVDGILKDAFFGADKSGVWNQSIVTFSNRQTTKTRKLTVADHQRSIPLQQSQPLSLVQQSLRPGQ
jgi:hypothetical protein